ICTLLLWFDRLSLRRRIREPSHVTLDVDGFHGDVGAPARGFIVHDHDPVALTDQAVGQRRANEAGAPCDQNVHATHSATTECGTPLSTSRRSMSWFDDTHFQRRRTPSSLSTSGRHSRSEYAFRMSLT